MGSWYKSHEDLPTVRLVLLAFCFLLAFQGPVGHLTFSYSLGWGLIINQVGVMLLPTIALCRFLNFDAATLFPFYGTSSREWRWVLISTFCVVILSDVSLALTEDLFSIPPHIQETLNQLLIIHNFGDFSKKLLLFCVLPAIIEEVYFRGFIQTSLAHRIGPTPAILLAALLFALAHGNTWYLHLYFGLGCFLGWIYERCGSLWPAITAHFINNTWTLTSHMLGWDFISDRSVTTQIGLLVALLIILAYCLRRWNLKPVTIQNT